MSLHPLTALKRLADMKKPLKEGKKIMILPSAVDLIEACEAALLAQMTNGSQQELNIEAILKKAREKGFKF